MLYPNGDDGVLRLRQWWVRPTVYLDHAPLRRFSENRALGDRLIAAIKSKNGTLAFSRLNCFEFSGLTDRSQAVACDAFIFRAIPNVFVMEVNPSAVAERELLRRRNDPVWTMKIACNDDQFLNLPDPIPYFRDGTIVWPSGIFELFVASRPKYQQIMAQGKAETKLRILAHRRYITSTRDRDYLIQRKKLYKMLGAQGAKGILRTDFVMDFLELALARNLAAEIDDHDMIDLYHACVPSTYCNFVALDTAWCARVNDMRQELRKNGMQCEFARVFNPSPEGLNNLIKAIEETPASQPPPIVTVAEVAQAMLKHKMRAAALTPAASP